MKKKIENKLRRRNIRKLRRNKWQKMLFFRHREMKKWQRLMSKSKKLRTSLLDSKKLMIKQSRRRRRLNKPKKILTSKLSKQRFNPNLPNKLLLMLQPLRKRLRNLLQTGRK